VPLDVEFRTVRPDGGLRWVRLIGRAPRFEGARPSILYGVISDIEPHRRAEAERLDLLRRLAEAQENEQRRIARELHDQVGQTVTGLSLGLKGLQETLGPGADGKVMAQLRWLRDLVVDIGRDIHRAAMDLRPTALDDLGLHKALLAYVSEWSERYGINVDVQAVGLESRPAAEVETVVYRVIQEALTNVLKHARARNVSVVLEQRSNRLRVVIEDDGIGFHPEEISEQGSRSMRSQLGLSGIRERLSFIGGSLHLESAPGGGTAVFLEVPLAPSGGPP
jgi:signal transduction histidine kinase